jgi:hypothetical protein
MKRNNKLSRRRAQPKQLVAVQQDGTEVIHSKESRAKTRRWSFEADVEIVVPESKDEETGVVTPGKTLPPRTMKLDGMSYTTAKNASLDCQHHEKSLRRISPMFANSLMRVRAIPHETISNATLTQLSGYRDMSMILDRALEIAIGEAADVVNGKSVGSQFVETPGSEGVKAVLLADIKEQFYGRARKDLEKAQADSVISQTGTSNVQDNVDQTIPNSPASGSVILTDPPQAIILTD